MSDSTTDGHRQSARDDACKSDRRKAVCFSARSGKRRRTALSAAFARACCAIGSWARTAGSASRAVRTRTCAASAVSAATGSVRTGARASASAASSVCACSVRTGARAAARIAFISRRKRCGTAEVVQRFAVLVEAGEGFGALRRQRH